MAMIEMYSRDLRQVAVRLYAELKSFRDVSRLLKVSVSTIHSWVRRGIDKVRRSSFVTKLTGSIMACITRKIAETPITTHDKIREAVQQECSTHLCRNTLAKALKALNITRKRTSKRMGGPASPERVAQYAARFIEETGREDGSEVISIDECGFSESQLPLYGYAKAGTRVVVRGPGGWKHKSLLMAVSSTGRYWFAVFDGAVKGAMYNDFVSRLPPRACLVMDNASIHKRSPGRVLFTPPYSPELNPIEYMFSSIKHRFRQDMANRGPLLDAIHRSVQVQPSQIISCFSHVVSRCKKIQV
jgi:transposase